MDAETTQSLGTESKHARFLKEDSTRMTRTLSKSNPQTPPWTALTAAMLFGLSTPIAKGLLSSFSAKFCRIALSGLSHWSEHVETDTPDYNAW